MSLPTGTQLGPYEILALIGAGGMGEVYRARDPRIGREVAIKVLPAALASDADRLRRFEQEARTAGSLNHPNILVIHDIGTHAGAPYVVSELLEGQTLRERLGDGPLGQRKAIEYALAVAQGLAAAHDRDIVHRDLKPENLFLTSDGRVKILDFGLAKLLHREPAGGAGATSASAATATEMGVVLGTAGYMSPEQVKGQPVTHAADIFAFGAILYEMLSGRRAFWGETSAETMTAILREDALETPAGMAAPLERIVRHCLEKIPQQRFQSARDLAFALEALSGTSAPGAAAPVAAGPSQRRLWPALLVAAVVVAAAAAGFFAGGRVASRPFPSFHQLTFRHGYIPSARFAPDGQTMIYGAAWDGSAIQLFSTRPEGPESRPSGLPAADILSVSSNGEMAISMGKRYRGHVSSGTLAQVALAGAAPREVLEGVQEADWAPDGATLAVVRRVEGRHRLEFPIGKVLYQTEGWISHARVSPDGKLVAFLDHPVFGDDLGSVAVVDRAGKSRVLSSGWISAQGLAWIPSGREIWFTASERGNARGLWSVAASGGGGARLLLRMAGVMLLQDIYRDGRVLLNHDTGQLRTMCLPPGESTERDLSWFDWSFAQALSEDGKTMVISEQGEAGGPRYSVYIRKTDGSPGVRIGEGRAMGLSPDGKWVLSILQHTSPARLVLLPTGAGEGRPLSYGSFDYRGANWFPDGKRILVQAAEPGKATRLYVQDLAGGAPRAISAEGFGGSVITLDGKQVACTDPNGVGMLCPAEGGAPRPIPGLAAGEAVISFTADGQSSYVFRPGELPAQVYRLNLATGKRELWKELRPADPAGTRGITRVLVTPDGKSYAYHYSRFLSELFLVEGLR